MKTFKIKKIKGSQSDITEDFLIEEVPLTIVADEKEWATLLCSPIEMEDLIRGFLFTSGIIETVDHIKKINIDNRRWTAYVELLKEPLGEDFVFKRVYTSGCGKGTLYYNANDLIKKAKIKSSLTVAQTWLFDLMVKFQKQSELYFKTGGAHAAALADTNGIMIFREDIGRHNAVDKVIGYSLEKKISFEDKILLSSGRISSEVLHKAQKCHFPIIMSRGAPTDQAVELGRDLNITVIGFVRGQSMNIYSVPERIILREK